MKKNVKYVGVTNKDYAMIKSYKVKRKHSIEVPAKMAEKVEEKISDDIYDFEVRLEKEAEQKIKEIDAKISALDKEMDAIFNSIKKRTKEEAIKITETFPEKHPEYFI